MKTVTFRIPDVLRGHVLDEARARCMTVTRFVCEALEREVIRSARRRHALVGVGVDAIDLIKEEGD